MHNIANNVVGNLFNITFHAKISNNGTHNKQTIFSNKQFYNSTDQFKLNKKKDKEDGGLKYYLLFKKLNIDFG